MDWSPGLVTGAPFRYIGSGMTLLHGGGLSWPGSSFDVIVVLADLAEIWRRDIFCPFWKIGNIKIIDLAHLVQIWAILAKCLFSKIEDSFLLKMDLVESYWIILGEKIKNLNSKMPFWPKNWSKILHVVWNDIVDWGIEILQNGVHSYGQFLQIWSHLRYLNQTFIS